MDKLIKQRVEEFSKETIDVQQREEKLEKEFREKVLQDLFDKKDYKTLKEIFDILPECYMKLKIFRVLDSNNQL